MNKIKLYVLILLTLCFLNACQNSDQVLTLEDIYAEPSSDLSSEELASENLNSVKLTAENSSESSPDTKEAPSKISVFVCGAVEKPGVYELESGARVNDALLLAGGFTVDADLCYVNLAQQLTDGLQIYFPTKEEVENMSVTSDGNIAGGNATVLTGNEGADAGKVNINTATVEQLMTLNGIGKSKAEAIISYRQENGMFKSVHDLVNVTGIGEGTLKKLLPLICV